MKEKNILFVFFIFISMMKLIGAVILLYDDFNQQVLAD